MCLLELTPGRVIDPRCVCTEHGVNGARQFASRGDSGSWPADAHLLCEVVVRQPAVRRVLDVRDDGPHQGATQPAIRAWRNGSVSDRREAGLSGARDEAGVTREMTWRAEPRDGQSFGAEHERALRPDAGDGHKQTRLWNRAGDVGDATIEGANERAEAGDHTQVGAHEHALLAGQMRPRGCAQPLPASASEQATAFDGPAARVQLRMNAIDASGALGDEARAMAQQRGPLAL